MKHVRLLDHPACQASGPVMIKGHAGSVNKLSRRRSGRSFIGQEPRGFCGGGNHLADCFDEHGWRERFRKATPNGLRRVNYGAFPQLRFSEAVENTPRDHAGTGYAPLRKALNRRRRFSEVSKRVQCALNRRLLPFQSRDYFVQSASHRYTLGRRATAAFGLLISLSASGPTRILLRMCASDVRCQPGTTG
jgi:hypothetical protein